LSKNNILQTFRSIIFNHLFYVVTLAVIFFTSCQQPDHGKALSKIYGNTYIEFDGVMMQQDVRINTSRKLLSNIEKGRIVFITNISQNTDIAGFSGIKTKTVSEYLIADSLYSYDSSDSSYIAVSLNDLDYPEFDEALFSSFWLPHVFSAVSVQKDTMIILGNICRKSMLKDYSFWMHDGIRLAGERNRSGSFFQEKATNFVTDTVINPIYFEQPKGFHRMTALVIE
jgi:hypothetical protein